MAGPISNLPPVQANVARVAVARTFPPPEVVAPADTFGGTIQPPANISRGLKAKLSALGKSVATGVANCVGGLGLFLIGPHHSKQQEKLYRQGEMTLKQDPGVTDRVAKSAFDGLLELMERPDLPGDDAKQRLDFIMWLTDSNRDSKEGFGKKLTQIFCHFNPESPFVTQANDRGFASDVADGRKWYNPQATGFIPEVYHGQIDQGSPQVGHFLTAVDIGRPASPLEKLLHTAALGHELVGDDQGALKQTILGLTHRHERGLFGNAVKAAERSDRVEAHRLVEEALPDLTDSGQEPGRVGNSRQDLLNTSYGLALGRLIRNDGLGTRQQAADWLRKNVGSQAPTIPWNDPKS